MICVRESLLPSHKKEKSDARWRGGVGGRPQLCTPRLLDRKARKKLMKMLVKVTCVWFGGCFPPHGGEEGPAAVVAQCGDHKEGRRTQ